MAISTIVAVAGAAAAVASAGVGIASAVGAFDEDIEIPSGEDPRVAEAKRLQRLAAARARGRQSNILAGPGGVEDASFLARPTLTGPGGVR